MESNKKGTKTLHKRNRLEHLETRLTFTKGKTWAGRNKLGVGTDIYTLLHIKEMGTGNCTQSPGLARDGRQCEKNNVRVSGSLCCTAEINTTL